MKYPKPPKPYRNKAYLEWVSSQLCCACDKQASIAHHIRKSYWEAGASQKPHDYCTIPLCHICDDKIHNARLKIENVERLIIDYLMKYIDQMNTEE